MALVKAMVTAVLVTFVLGFTAPLAHADPNTGRIRTLDCGPSGTYIAELGPAEFITTTNAALHIVESTSIIVPYRVEIVFPDGTSMVTLSKKLPNGQSVVSCTYTDPAGLGVTIAGIITS